MTLNLTPLTELSDDDLLFAHAACVEELRVVNERKARMEMEMERRMTVRGATAILHEFFEVKLETPSTLDPERLRPLAELIPPDEWQRGFVEAHEETVQVPAKADLRVVKGWAKYGSAIAEGIEKAKVYGQARVKITPKGR